MPSDLPLADRLHGRVVVLGVGNRMKSDDGAGPALIDRIAGRVSAECIDAGSVPENFLEVVVRGRPDTILIVDAADFRGKPGETRLFGAEEIAESGLSTHSLSLHPLCAYLKQRSGVEPILLAVQAEQVRLGEDLSPSVVASVDRVAALLCEALPPTSSASPNE